MSKKITFYMPNIIKYKTKEITNCENNKFPAITITGRECALNCKHCEKKFLETLFDASNPDDLFKFAENLYNEKGKGFLITGGSNQEGYVNIKEHYETISKIKQKFKFQIALHSGLITEENIEYIKKSNVDLVMIDIIGDNKTIKEIYHLDKKVEDFENSLKLLQENKINFAPHVLIGLYNGKLGGEKNAIDIISKYQEYLKKLVLIVYRPLSHYKKNLTPKYNDIKDIFEYTKENINKEISLGCARPFGKLRYEIDKLAVDLGFSSIAYPAEDILSYCILNEIEFHIENICCSF
jgi:uncharacterized radical SAM superfamily protein